MSYRGRGKPASVNLRPIHSQSTSNRGDEAENAKTHLLVSSSEHPCKRPSGEPSGVRNVRLVLKRKTFISYSKSYRNIALGNPLPEESVRIPSESASTNESEKSTPRTRIDRSRQSQALLSSGKAVFNRFSGARKVRDRPMEERKNSPKESEFPCDSEVSPTSKTGEIDYSTHIKSRHLLERYQRHAKTQPPSKGLSSSIIEKSYRVQLRWQTLMGKYRFFRASAELGVLHFTRAVTKHIILQRKTRKFQGLIMDVAEKSIKREKINVFSDLKTWISHERIHDMSNALGMFLYRRSFGAIRIYVERRRRFQEFRNIIKVVAEKYATRELMNCLSTIAEIRRLKLQLFRNSLENAILKHTEKEVKCGLGDFCKRLLAEKGLFLRLSRAFDSARCRYTFSVLETRLNTSKRLTKFLSIVKPALDRVRILSFFYKIRSFDNPKSVYRIRYMEKPRTSLWGLQIPSSLSFLTVVLQALIRVFPLSLLERKSTFSEDGNGAGKVMALCVGDSANKERTVLEALSTAMPGFFTGMLHSPSSFLYDFLRNLEADSLFYAKETIEEIRKVYSIRIEDVYTCSECQWTYRLVRYLPSLELPLAKAYKRDGDGVVFFYPKGEFYAPDLVSAYPIEADSGVSREIYAKTLLSYVRNPTFSQDLETLRETETGLVSSLYHYMRTVSLKSICPFCNKDSKHYKQSFLRSTGSCLFLIISDPPRLNSDFLLPRILRFDAISGIQKTFQLSQVITRSGSRSENDYTNYMETNGNWAKIDQGRISTVSKVKEALENAQILIYRDINS